MAALCSFMDEDVDVVARLKTLNAKIIIIPFQKLHEFCCDMLSVVVVFFLTFIHYNFISILIIYNSIPTIYRSTLVPTNNFEHANKQTNKQSR